MPEKLDSCVKCGGPIHQPKTGRPAIYCGPACRTAAGYEVQRVLRRLEAFEQERSHLRHERDFQTPYLARKAKQRKVDVEEEIATDEARLRLLLSEPRGKSPAPKRGVNDAIG